MRKSENTPAVASRPATKSSKRDAADAMRSATEYLIATRQAERALKAGNCAPPFDCGATARRGRVENAAQAPPAAPYLLHRLVVPGVQPGLAGV
jgi:hypothetical protein